ncbi:hypothetical protein KFE94_15425 [bacterium SCSIO 12643]|nr:hypothetical protein KFE94_15425 [bacterium SCSIO 12643]
MNTYKTLLTLITILFVTIVRIDSYACSMYKITFDGKTMVGCNEDAWRINSRIWFLKANKSTEYGAGFTGSRQVGVNQFAPQSGMNEVGLVFSRLGSYHPKQNLPLGKKKKITNEVDFLTDILQKCATVDEVKKYIEQYDHSIFIDDVFMYIDRTGKYLVVEPYKLIIGDDRNYVLSNFCPSITDDQDARRLERYRNGADYLKSHSVNASLDFCRSLSDTMHVCRSRNGDGTLLTSIWDIQKGNINLYFYHDYDSTVQFNLAEELEKGNHIIDVETLFPINSEFKRLASYKTPFNTPILRILLAALGGILPFISLLFIIGFVRNKKVLDESKVLILIIILNVVLALYFFVLTTNIGIYYFDAPYEHHGSKAITISSYIPYVFSLFIVPVGILTFRFFRAQKNAKWTKGLLLFNNMIYVAAVLAFVYWGLL